MSETSFSIRLGCLGMLVVFAFLGPAAAAERTVLGEFISSDYCVDCQAAAPFVSGLIDSYPDFGVIGVHFGDEFNTSWGNARATFYGPMGFTTPFFVFDGLTAPASHTLYEAEYLSNLAVVTDVTIDLSAAPSAGRDEAFDFTAHVCVETGGQSKLMRIYMVEVLDNYPETADFDRNGFRQAAATEDLPVNAGACTDVVKTMTLDATSMSRTQDVRIIAWAQAPLDTGPAEVYQAAILSGPFDAIFSDGFESGNIDSWN